MLKPLLAALPLFLLMPAHAAVLVGVTGAAYDLDDPVTSVDHALAAIDGRTPDATFTVSTLDYPAGSANTVSSGLGLADLLGDDAGSISGENIGLWTSVIAFEGQVSVTGGPTTFSVGSDDGFALFVSGVEVARYAAPRSFSTTEVTLDMAPGLASFALVYYENFGNTGVSLHLNGVAAAAVSTPTPGAISLMVSGVGMAAGMRAFRRRRP